MKFKNENQSGRSMVEMLGVLAIIGVLSVAGISGYRMAMNKHQANEWINLWNLSITEFKGDFYKISQDIYTKKKSFIYSNNDFEIMAHCYGEDVCNNEETPVYVEIFRTPSLKNEDVCVEILSTITVKDVLPSSNQVIPGVFIVGDYITSFPDIGPFSKDLAEEMCARLESTLYKGFYSGV